MLLLLMFLILFTKKALVDSSPTSICIESEWRALMEFKASINNDTSLFSSWNGRHCCSWYGVTCHNLTHRVQSLNLSDDFDYSTRRYFNSPISPWLFNLTHLEFLSLRSSGLKGPIPNMFEKLTSLTHLDLSVNSFDSGIFPDSLCSLTSLTIIHLRTSKLHGSLPSCLGNLTSLTDLWLGGNELRGETPSWLNNLTHLTSLGLSRNMFNSISPSSFGHQQHLEYLYLDNNQLSGTIPSNVGNLTKLKYLLVRRNFLTINLSESFFERLTSLLALGIGGNPYLVFSVSPQWVPPFQLWFIYMEDSFLETQFPPWLQTQRNLESLYMRNASISGTIPSWFSSAFPNLYLINLSNNLLTGHVPNLTAFPNLDTIDLSKNSLTGNLTAFPNLDMYTIDLSKNSLTGNIPTNLCNLTSLEVLSLASNKLTGRIPSCLGSLTNLAVLDLANNSLSGTIPNELVSLRYLLFLHLNGNKLYGKLPSSVQNLSSLVTLDLGNNELQGSIPHWIGKDLLRLQNLRLESNHFSGDIPINLCQLSSLQILDLALNDLVGTIPPCIGNLRMMVSDESGQRFNFAYYERLLNIIKGVEMEYTSSLPYAKFVSLSGNRLQGEIPVQLMNLRGLQSLNLSNNELTGMIPENINNLKLLESLDLSMNHLSGKIPQSLADIDDLSYLNLSFNNLEGKVPSGAHFSTLDDPSIYKGNIKLCGKMLPKSCPEDDPATYSLPNVVGDDEFDQLSWFFAGIGPGFAVGFLGVVCILYFKDPWRIAYFGFVDSVYNKVWVTSTIKFSQLRRMFN